MSRTLPTGFATKTEAKVFSPVFLVFLDWPGAPVYLWNGYGTISWDSQTWTGTGQLGTISPIGESKDLRANGVSLTMSGIPSGLIAEALGNDSQGAVGKIWVTSMAAGGTFEMDPYQVFEGFIDIVPIEDNGTTSTISVQLEKELIDKRLNDRRTTHEDQQIDYPDDLIFSFITGLQDKQFNWGGKSPSNSVNASPGLSAYGKPGFDDFLAL